MDNIKSNPKKVFKFVGLLQTLKIIPNIQSQNSVSFSNIDIRFTSSANEGHSVDTPFCYLYSNPYKLGFSQIKILKTESVQLA